MTQAQDDDLVMSLVELALGQPPDSREAYVRASCRGDRELLRFGNTSNGTTGCRTSC